MEITQLRAPLIRHKTEPLPKIIFTSENSDEVFRNASQSDDESDNDEGKFHFDSESLFSDGNGMSLPDMTVPEVTYGLKPRMAWMYRLMERAGIGARSARGLPWCENEKESFQHHAEYLKRLSKLREELIQQEQNNLANALDRLRMRSYGREYVYSQPQKEKRARQRNSAQSDVPIKRNSLLTTFEKFQRMRPKKTPPTIMPLEGKSLIDAPVTERQESHARHERHHGYHSNRSERGTERSVDENVRVNLQRLTTHPIPSIPRKGRNNHRDIVLESSSFRRSAVNDANNSSTAEERIAQMQKQKQKLMKLRHDAREAEKEKLMPQSFRIDTLSDEDRMNLEKLKDYYCIYYVPAPSTSPVGDHDLHVHLPKIGTNGSCNQSFIESDSGGSSLRSSRSNGLNGKQVGFRVTTDLPIPPCTCNCSCKMYITGNKVETPIDHVDFSINKTHALNNPNFKGYVHHKTNGYSRESSKSTEKSWNFAKSLEKHEKHGSPPNSQEKKRIRVDMPAIVYNTISSPEPVPIDYQTGLVKAFKQKELRQKELSNLMEDVRELNKMTETMNGTAT